MPNQLYKRALLLGALFCFSFAAVGQQQPKIAPPGVLESIDELITIHKTKITALDGASKNNFKQILTDYKSENIRLHPIFSQSLLLFSAKKYVELIELNECHFYSMLHSGLLKTALGKVTKPIVIISKDGKEEVAQIALEDYIRLKTANNCQNTTEIAKIFELNNLKSTFKKISFNTPKDLKQCLQIQSEWKLNAFLPFVCSINNMLSIGRRAMANKTAAFSKLKSDYNKIESATTLFQRSYINSLCKYLDDTAKYCSLYLSNVVWDKILNAEKPEYYLSSICNDLTTKNKNFSKTQLRLCRNKLVQNPKLCQRPGVKKSPNFLPHQDCETISETLNHGTLFFNYPECPEKVDNESVTTFHRLYAHFDKEKRDYSQTQCHHAALSRFAEVNISFQNELAWPMKLCYFDKFEDKEVCEKYIPGDDPDEQISETNLVSKIINKQISLSSEVKCRLVPQDSYKPQFLEFKQGCFIVYDENNCNLSYCDKEIILNKKPIDLIKYTGMLALEHIPNSYANEKFSQENVLNETFKLSSRRMLNLTVLKNYLNSGKNRIVHGVGCLEDLLPTYFTNESLQSCTPHPFIIDGINQKEGDTFVVFRSSIEDVHYPRLVRWQNIFNAVANFKEIHPLKSWALFGVGNAANDN